MDVINVFIGILLNILGVLLIKYYLSLIKEKKHGGLSIKAVGAGVIFIMIGVYLILKEFKG